MVGGREARQNKQEYTEALWELKPLDRRQGQRQAMTAADDGVVEMEEVPDRPPTVCFGNPLFGGCTLCTTAADDFVQARPVQRLRVNWEASAVPFCSAERGRCGARPDELVEEVEETTSIGDDDKSVVSEDTSEVTGSLVNRGQADSSQDLLHQQLEAVRWSAGDVFAARGWSLTRLSAGRYRFMGRTIKLFLLSPGAPLPFFQHLQKIFDYDTAERAATIMVCDGSLRQPLLDYLLQTGQNESYDERGTENIAGVSGAGKFLDWNTQGTDDRILEMTAAKMQADMRRSAAGESERVSALQIEGSKLLSRTSGAGPNYFPNNAGGVHGMPQVFGTRIV